MNKNKIFNIVALSFALTSLLFVMDAFVMILLGQRVVWMEPSKIIASIELLFVVGSSIVTLKILIKEVSDVV